MNELYYINIPHATTVYKISTNINKFSEQIKLHYGSMVECKPRFLIDRETDIDIIAIDKNIKITKGSEVLFEAALDNNININFCVCMVMSLIREQLHFQSDWNAYHGSAVKIKDKCFLFLASTHSGKTTLTSFLSYQPYSEIISEDLAIINFNNQKIISINAPVFMRKNSYELLKEKYGIYFKDIKNTDYNMEQRFYTSENLIKHGIEYKIDAIFFLNLDCDATFSLVKTSDFTEMLLNCYCYNDILKNTCSSIKMMKNLPIYKMYYYDLREVYSRLYAF